MRPPCESPITDGPDQPLGAAVAGFGGREAWEGFDRVWRAVEARGECPHGSAEVEAARERLHRAGEVFAATPALTLRGVAVKLRHIVQDVEDGHPAWFRPLLHGTLRDVERLAGVEP